MAVLKFLDPKNDITFKKIFGLGKNKDILIHFINDIIRKDTEQIQDVIFLSPVQYLDTVYKKQSLVNVLCKAPNGIQIIVEMQASSSRGLEKRPQYYAHKVYSRTSEAGLQKIIGSDIVIQRAYEALNQFNWNEIELIAYEQGIKRIWDSKAAEAFMVEPTEAIGETYSEAHGKVEGERKKALEIAKSLLNSGINIELVAKSI